ncbi:MULTISPECIES: hypothetical protein [Aphanothece]|uniref:hypothetical protein n=1 Tax=Aphanothece TaxID=1121 RepID=UPI003984E9A4
MTRRFSLPRLPLRVTALTTGLLLIVPAVALLRLPRPRAEGLARLLAQAALLQSFPAASQRPVPQLWRERLGEGPSEQLWRQQQRVWWQFWGRHGDGGAYLALPMPRPMRMGTMAMPPHSLRVDDLVVVAADPLSHRLLADQLKQLPRQRRGLEQRCLTRLEREQAAFWNPTAFGAMGGPVAPLLQSFQEGCVSLRLIGDSLELEGEAAPTTGLLAPPPPAASGSLPGPLGRGLLLELQGRSLELLLQGLLSRQLIRDPLASRYGIGRTELALLRRTPFVLRLRPLDSGPFQAGLELQLAPGADRPDWARLLSRLRQALIEQGFNEGPAPGQAAPPPGSTQALPTSTWSREEAGVVGGWRWTSVPGRDPELLLFLGPVPPVPDAVGSAGAPARATSLLQLRLRPQALTALGLLPDALPRPLLQADQLTVLAERSRAGGAMISRLKGRLQLGTGSPPPAPPAPPPR